MTCFCSCSGSLASMLEVRTKRKQPRKASCDNCRGRSLVDGIEPEPASMLSKVDLELTNFINPDLTWKNVKKVCRSRNRRSTKLIVRSFTVGIELSNKSRKVDQDSVSESEKLGVAVLGRRFTGKVADVPIKKRRLLTGTSSPDYEEKSDQLVERKPAAARRRVSQGMHSNNKNRAIGKSLGRKSRKSVDEVQSCEKFKMTNVEYGFNDDFSGIRLLAAAACNSSIDDVAGNVRETSLVEGFAKAERIDSPNAALPFKESIGSSGTGNFSEKELVNEDDLGESFVEDSKFAGSLDNNKNKNGGIAKNRAHWDLNTVMEAWEEPYEDPLQEDKPKACSSPKGSSPTEHAAEPVNSVDASGNYCRLGTHHAPNSHVSEEKINTSASVLKQMGEDSYENSVAQNRKSLSGSSRALKLEVLSPDVPILIKSSCEIDGTQTKDFVNLDKTSGLPDSTLTCKSSYVGNSVGESYKADHFHLYPKGEALSASSTSVVIAEVKREVDKSSTSDNTVNDFGLQNGPMELLAKSNNFLGKVTQDGHVEHITEYEAGYDSSFEDGELREPGVYSWEENEEGEAECVDYGSDYEDRDDFDADYSVSENLETGRGGYQVSKKGNLLSKNDDIEKIGMVGNRSEVDGYSVKSLERCDVLRERSRSASLKTRGSAGYQLNEHLKYRIADGNVDGPDHKGSIVGEFGSKASRGTYSKGPYSFDVLERENKHPVQRSRYDRPHYSYSRTERDFNSKKSMGRDRFSFRASGTNEAHGYWVDSADRYRETRNRYPHSYRGPEGHGFSRPGDTITNSGVKVGGPNFDDDRRPINYPSNSMYRPFIRNRSLADRDYSYGGERRMQPVRGMGRDRGRGQSGSFAQGIWRGAKDEYPEDVLDDHRPQYFARREQGFSPSYNSTQISRPRRSSRSRTRSPVEWRDRNLGPRLRSPNFRSDAGMRSPFQKPSFAADSEELFVSPPRGRMSPRRNSRWFDDGGNYMDNNFRDRRSPGRMFRRSQQFDSVGYTGRSKPDGFFRPVRRRGGFHQMSCGTGRSRDFDESKDERNHNDRFEMSHRVRRYDAGGAVRRFRYDSEDCFEAHNPQKDCFKSTIKRDIPRSGDREEIRPRCNSDMINASATSSGQRDCKEDVANMEE